MAAVGRLSSPEWLRYPDPATELDVLRLTNPAFSSGMTDSHLRQFTRHGDTLLYWSERYEADAATGSRQAFLLDLKGGGSRQLTEAATLDPASLALSADDRSYFFFDGPSLKQAPVTGTSSLSSREIHAVPPDAVRSGFTIGLRRRGDLLRAAQWQIEHRQRAPPADAANYRDRC